MLLTNVKAPGPLVYVKYWFISIVLKNLKSNLLKTTIL